MGEFWRIGILFVLVVFVLGGCGTLQGAVPAGKNEPWSATGSLSAGDNIPRGERITKPPENEKAAVPPAGKAAEKQSDPATDIYRQVTDQAQKDFDEGITALLDNEGAKAESKFREALGKVKTAQEKYPPAKERLEQFYLSLKKDIEETRKDKLPDSPGKAAKGEAGLAKAEPVLLVAPEILEKLGAGDKPLEKPRQINSDLPVVINEPVEKFIRVYQNMRGGYFYEGLARMGRYQPYIEKVFKEKGLPLDLIYVGLIESAYNPHVLSRARALGIWQFIPGTGRLFRLRQDFWVDERKDFEKSTVAAANYLKALYERFGDWPLALAGYNAGEGRVEWAIRRKKTRDYWQLRLPRETRLYVPAIYAAIIIGKNSGEYGFKDLKKETPFEYEKVTIPDATDLAIIADCAGVDPQLIRDMNPELLRWCTPPKMDYEVKIPVGTKAKFLEKFARIPKEQWVSWRTHKVRPGENMGRIGRLYRIPAATLAKMNHLKSVHRIRAGQILMIPVPWGAPLPHQGPTPKAVLPPAPVLPEVKPESPPSPVKAEAKAPEVTPPTKPD